LIHLDIHTCLAGRRQEHVQRLALYLSLSADTMAYDTVVFRRLLPSPPAPPVGMLALRVLDAHSEPIGSRTSPLKREVSQRPECQPRYPDVLQFRHGSRGAKWRRC